MTEHVCSIVGCDEPAESQGMCARHFTRALIYGQVRLTEAQRRQDAARRIVAQ